MLTKDGLNSRHDGRRELDYNNPVSGFERFWKGNDSSEETKGKD